MRIARRRVSIYIAVLLAVVGAYITFATDLVRADPHRSLAIFDNGPVNDVMVGQYTRDEHGGIQPGPEGVLELMLPDDLDLEPFHSLCFWLRTPSDTEVTVTFVYDHDQPAGMPVKAMTMGGTWKEFYLPLSKLVEDPAFFDKTRTRAVRFKPGMDTEGPLYIDQIELTTRRSPTPR